MIASVRDFVGKLLGRACQIRLLAWIVIILGNRDALLLEGKLNGIQVLLRVESDLNSTCASADALHVVFIEGDVNDVLST